MSHIVEVKIPKLGESILTATIVHWFKKVGDHVALDETLLEVATDKVNSEIPSPVAGVLKEILAPVNQTLDVGALICRIETSSATEAVVPQSAPQVKQSVECPNDFLSPAVIRFAADNGISMAELDRVPRSGAGGRLSRKDIENYLTTRLTSEEKVPLTFMRKAIADQMVKSFYEAPHATLVMDVDITAIMQHIKAEKERFFQEHGFKLTITAFISEAIAKAATQFPYVNASFDQDGMILKKSVGLGIAVSVDEAIVVPVIKNAHRLSLIDIAKQVGDLAYRAKTKTLTADDVQGGSITMTNFGMGGALIGIPILRYKEVAIIGVGKIDRRVSVLEDDSTAIRSIVHLSLTFDHRAIDGMYGCDFLSCIKKELEGFKS